MMRAIQNVLRRVSRRGGAKRRGAVLLLALGVLGILAIAAISYVTIVRLDRSSAQAGSRRANYQQQPEAVINYIGSLLAADLVGNKIVTDSVPHIYWPTMFEDGDTRDIPTTDLDRARFNSNDPGLVPSSDAILPAFNRDAELPSTRMTAYPDDAWLASIEPYWNPVGASDPNQTRYWPQITNLRSAYVWDDSLPGAPRWVRDNGRFVDIGQWFLSATVVGSQVFPNPGVELMRWNGTNAVTAEGRLGPEKGLYRPTAPDPYQAVYQYQMNTLSRVMLPADHSLPTSGEVDPLTPWDERQWVDTDGDLRPDARWQQLDALGNLFGLNWVVAARIVDASALVNVNTALEFGPQTSTDRYADGRTPADVDLYRLLRRDIQNGVYTKEVRRDRVQQAFTEWVNQDLDVTGILAEARQLGGEYFTTGVDFIPDPPDPWNATLGLRRREREAYYRYFAGIFLNPQIGRGSAAPIRDLLDLHGFFATNNLSLASRSELRFDGPSSNGYLPGALMDYYGPLRSREEPEDIRSFAAYPEAPNEMLPSLRQIKDSTRRLLTTVSGDAPFSPVPVLNTTPNSPFRSVAYNEKVPLDSELSSDTLRRAFEAFAWALAPLAVDIPQSRELREFNFFNLRESYYHYGGGVGGPAEALGRFRRFAPRPAVWEGTAPDDASFAVVTAASLAVNLADALDGQEGQGPTVARIVAAFSDTGTQLAKKDDIKDPAGRPVHVMGTAFSHGVIPEQNASVLGPAQDPTFDPTLTGAGVTVVGLDHQPFLSEFTTIAAYSGTTRDGDPNAFQGPPDDTNVLGTPETRYGSAIIFELVNPWPTPISLQGYSVVIPESEDQIGTTPFVVELPDIQMDPGRHTFSWVLKDAEVSTWDAVADEILDRSIFQASVSLDNEAISPTPDSDDRIPFLHVSSTGDRRPVLLVYGRSGTFPGYVVDRMAPDVGEAFPYAFNETETCNLALQAMSNLNEENFSFDNWFSSVGYLVPGDPRIDTGQVTGRILVTSTLQRPSTRSSSASGFPAYVLEIPNANHTFHRVDGHAWLFPVDVDGNLPDDPVGNIDAMVGFDLITGDAGGLGIDPGLFTFPDDHTDIGEDPKAADSAPGAPEPARLPPFQLYVPPPSYGPENRTRLNALSELHMISSYAHTCRAADAASPQTWQDELSNLANWQTVGEKLGLSLNRDFSSVAAWDPSTTPSYPDDPLNTPNVYIGTLDPTRSLLGSDLAAIPEAPDALSIPLALRVFDCFWPSGLNQKLAQGRININNAPDEVLRTLPLVHPEFEVGVGSYPLAATPDRLDAMLQYRDPQLNTAFKAAIGTPVRPEIAGRRPAGFVSTGELAILDTLDWTTGTPESPTTRWLEAADPVKGANDEPPLEFVTGDTYYIDPSFNPINDVEERLALYRAVSNIVTTRSDVFIAWFVLRGYDPAVIERIPISGAGQQARLSAMNDDNFRPAYESRWLVVFDRSNVRRPTDRPTVLLKVELPRASP